MLNLEKTYKLLIFIIIYLSGSVSAQEADEDVAALPVSPSQAALTLAREKLEADDKDGAVAELRTMFDSGFTSIGFLLADPTISMLSGYPDFDELAAEMEVQAYPCEHAEGFSDFDFWVGEWDVTVASGQVAGSNKITKQQRGCVLIEDWTNSSGGGGGSINYLDKVTGEWVQIWNDASGGQINIRGGLTDDGMQMKGTIHTVGSNTTLPFRALWTPLEDGRVRQFFEQSNDDGATWVPWFEGFYTRKDQE